MTSHSTATVTRGKRTVGVFTPAHIYESDDPTNPLHGSLVNADRNSVVITDGHKMLHTLRSDVTAK